MNLLLDNKEKILENRQLALAILSEENQNYRKIKFPALWQRCSSDYFLRNSPKQIAWHTELLAEFDGEVLVKISNRFLPAEQKFSFIVLIKPIYLIKWYQPLARKNSVFMMHKF